MLEGLPGRAMQQVDQARRTDWRALRIYLEGCEDAGLLPLCDLEYRRAGGWEGQVWRWHHAERGRGELGAQPGVLGELAAAWTAFERVGDVRAPDQDDPEAWRLKLRMARIRDDDRVLAKLGAQFLELHPEHPEVLSEVFSGNEGRRTRGLQRRIRRAYAGLPVSDVTEGYRRLRLWQSARAPAEAARTVAALEALGEPKRSARVPYSPAMEHGLAIALARQEQPEVHGPTHADRVQIAIALERRLRATGDLRAAERAWAGVRASGDDGVAALHHGRLLLELGEPAEIVATQAVVWAAGAPEDDRGRLDRARWKLELGEALELFSAATGSAETGSTPAPPIGLLAARVLVDPTPIDLETLAERSDSMLAAVLRHHRDYLEGVPTPAALAVHDAWARTAPVARGSSPVVVTGAPFELPGVELPAETTVIVAWASWCVPCKSLLPELDRLVARERRQGRTVHALAVSVDAAEAPYTQAAKRLALSAFAIQRAPSLLRDLQLASVPTVWMVDRDGVLRNVRSGYSRATVDAVRAHLEDR